MTKIKRVFAQEILDSRGNPTIETTIELTDDIFATASVPSGASKGTYEALELRDNDMSRFNGLGVLKAVENVNNVIGPKIIGLDVVEQPKIDKLMIELDGTQNKSKLGANAILSVSEAVAKAGAKSSLLPLFIYLRQFFSSVVPENKIPIPMFNLLEGGKHASNNLDFQEFLVIPASSKKYKESLEVGTSIYQFLKTLLKEKGLSTLVADEGGFAPEVASNREGLNLLKQAIEASSYKFTFDVFLGLDVAANSFKESDGYKLKDRSNSYSKEDLINYYKELFSDFSLIYLEDPFGEDDWNGWKGAYSALSAKTLIVGDDLVTTNPYRLQIALDNNAINGIIIKPNQIGTITEAIAVSEIAKFKKIKLVVSHRSGETMEDFIADFAVAIGADYVKFGAPSRERIIKYNRLLDIEKEMKVI